MDKQVGKDTSQQSGTNLKSAFENYCRFGDRESDGKSITLKNIDKWLKQASLLGDKKPITNADTAITFSKIAKSKKRMDINEFQEFLQQIAKEKKLEIKDLIEQLVACGQPEAVNATSPVSSGPAAANVERMTDTKLYTGAHKERFDDEGRGRGKEGREDTPDASGYVSGYKEKGTYDEKRNPGGRKDDDDDDDYDDDGDDDGDDYDDDDKDKNK